MHMRAAYFRRCNEPVPVADLAGVRSLASFYDALSPTVIPGGADAETTARAVEMAFTFAMIWSVGASVDEDGRREVDSLLREIDSTIPHRDTVRYHRRDPHVAASRCHPEDIRGHRRS